MTGALKQMPTRQDYMENHCLLYVRGQEEDYEDWSKALGCKGWSWSNVSKAFRAIENHDQDTMSHLCEKDYLEYGTIMTKSETKSSGTLNIASSRFHSELGNYFLKAAVEVGLPIRHGADINGNPQEGAGYFLQTAHNGFRCSSAVAHLNETFDRKNLHVVTNTMVSKIKLNSVKRAVGVTLTSECDGPIDIDLDLERHGGGEVILSAGSIGSPQLLQISGIGNQQVSSKIGVEHLVELNGVGQNLQDHLQLRQVFACRDGVPTLNTQLSTYFQQLLVGIQYVANRTGPLSMAASQVCAFVKTQEDMTRPDVQFHFQPLSASTPGAGLDSDSAFTSSVCQLRPSSVGSIDVVSSNPAVAPVIHPNYLSTEKDVRCAVAALRFSRRLCSETKAMSSVVGQEIRPGIHCRSDDELLQGAMQIAESIYHPAGTCKMGVPEDKTSVVDARLNVLGGVRGLRVVDCSIMPKLVSGNTNGPTMMIAQRASEMILEDQLLNIFDWGQN